MDGGYGSGIYGGEGTRCGIRNDERFGIDERKERKRSFYNAEKEFEGKKKGCEKAKNAHA